MTRRRDRRRVVAARRHRRRARGAAAVGGAVVRAATTPTSTSSTASGADFVLEDGQVRTVGRGVTLGLGVRVLRGDATGYAYTEELDRGADGARRRARRRRSRPAARAPGPIAVAPGAAARLATRSPSRRWRARAPTSSRCCAAPTRAARAYDPRIVEVEASLAEEMREILVVTSDGRLARDRQPMIRFGVRAVAEEGGKRQGGRSGGGGPLRHGVLRAARRRARRSTGARRRAWRSPCSTRVEAPAGQMEVVLGAGRLRASCCTRRSATGSRPTSTARGRRTTPTRSASRSRRRCARWSTTARSATRAARSTSTTRATPASATC